MSKPISLSPTSLLAHTIQKQIYAAPKLHRVSHGHSIHPMASHSHVSLRQSHKSKRQSESLHTHALHNTRMLSSTSPMVVALQAFEAAWYGGGNGGGWGNGNWGNWSRWGDDGDIARKLIDIFFGEACLPCDNLCSKLRKEIRLNVPAVVKATEGVVRAMDAALRSHAHQSLVSYLYNYVTARLNVKLRVRGIPLRSTRLLSLATMLQYNMSKGVRLKVLSYILTNYVDYYLPKVKYNVQNINTHIFSKFKPQIMAFLKGNDTDLAPLAGHLMGYFLEKNKVSLQSPNLCKLCAQLPVSCKSKNTRHTR